MSYIDKIKNSLAARPGQRAGDLLANIVGDVSGSKRVRVERDIGQALQHLRRAGLIVLQKARWYPAQRVACKDCKGTGFVKKSDERARLLKMVSDLEYEGILTCTQSVAADKRIHKMFPEK
jgi:hypothetical protein